MVERYDLAEALKSHGKPLTAEQFENFDRYMALTNGDKPADGVGIGRAAREIIEEMNKKESYWW